MSSSTSANIARLPFETTITLLAPARLCRQLSFRVQVESVAGVLDRGDAVAGLDQLGDQPFD
jgi:hypothetical protein